MLGKTEGKRRRGWQRMRWLDNITDSMDMNLSTISRTEEPGVLESMGLRRVGQDFSDRTTIKDLTAWLRGAQQTSSLPSRPSPF